MTCRKDLELKTARDRLMHPQQHLYNGLVRPANYSISGERYCVTFASSHERSVLLS